MTLPIFTTALHAHIQTTLRFNRSLYQGRTYSYQNPRPGVKDIQFKGGNYTGQVNSACQPEGQGTFTSPRGKVEGEWKQGRFITGIETFEDNSQVFVRDPSKRYSEI